MSVDSTSTKPPSPVINFIFAVILKFFLLTAPKCLGLHVLQAPIYQFLRPGHWLHMLTGARNNSSQAVLTASAAKSGEVYGALEGIASVTSQVGTLAGNDVLVDSDFVVPKNQDVNGKSFSVWFFTKNKQWLDVIEFKLEGEGESSATFRVNSFSSCIAPASFPLGWIFGLAMFWFPFEDVGMNKAHILTAAKFLTSKGVECEVEFIDHGGKRKAKNRVDGDPPSGI